MKKPTTKRKSNPPERCPFCNAATGVTMLGRVLCVGRNGCGNTVKEPSETGKLKLGVDY